MEKLTLITKSLSNGTYGELFKDGKRLCFMVEPPWENNEKGKSCVPGGTYELKQHTSPKYGKCFALEAKTLGVTIYGPSQRTHCLWHVANWPEQLEGCGAPGDRLHPTKWGVANSRKTLNMLLATLTDKTYELEIVRL